MPAAFISAVEAAGLSASELPNQRGEIMPSVHPLYESFIVRLGGESTDQTPDQRQWRGQIEHVQSGQRWHFSTLSEITAIIGAFFATPPAPSNIRASGEFRQNEPFDL